MILKFIKKNWLIIAILIIASFLRLYKIDAYMEFLGDQGRDVVIVRDFLKNGNLFFIGPQTSIGNMYLGPFYYYFIAPSLLFANFNPIGPAIFIALLGVLSVWLVYFISAKWFNQKTGYIASFLFAISPTAIKYSNFSWNPNIMPLFILLFVFFFFEALKRKKYKYFIYASIAFVFVLNSHYLGLSILPLAGLFWLIQLIILIKEKDKDIKSFLLNTFFACLIFLASFIPQLLFDLKHNGQNIKAFISFFVYRETTVSIKPYKAIPQIFPLFTQINTSLLAGKNQVFGLFLSIILIFGIVIYLIKSGGKIKPNFWIISFWYLFGLIALALYKQHIYDHYFGFLFPVVFMLVGFLISEFRLIGILFFIPIIFFSFVNNQFRWSPPNQLKTVNQIVDSIIKKSNQQEFNFALLAKQNYDPPYKYFLTAKNVKLVDTHDKVTEQLFVVCEPFQIDCNPINNPEWAIASFGWAKIDSKWDINGIKIFKLIHNK